MSFVPDDLEPIQAVCDRMGENALGVALASERIEAHYILDDGAICGIPAEYWCGKHARATLATGTYKSELGPPFDGAPVFIFIDEDNNNAIDSMNSSRSTGGRPSSDWDAVFIAAACQIATVGVPKTQAEFISLLQEQLGAKAPGDTQMKERIGPLFKAVQKALKTL